jgi:hypothetical protein
MAIIVKAGGNFTPAPAGTYAAVCVDVIDRGMVETTFQNITTKKRKIDIVWQIAELMDDGKPYLVRRRYTGSLSEKATLRRDLESWRGRAFTSAELKGFHLENLLGVGCLLNIVHRESPNGTYANVASIMPLPKHMTAPQPRDYVRWQDRPEAQTAQTASEDDADDSGITNDDVAF